MAQTTNTIYRAYIHCSYSPWGDAPEIRRWHLERGWSDIGYHFVICNSFLSHKSWALYQDKQTILSTSDGLIQTGRPLSIMGAHVKDFNKDCIGICYVGMTPSPAQFNSLLWLCTDLMDKYPLLTIENIRGHYEDSEYKTCPNFNMETFRGTLANSL